MAKTETAVKTRGEVSVTDKETGEIVVFQKDRLPYHPSIGERFGVDRSQWKALVEAIYPLAKTTDSVVMALSYCRARNLDPFKRPVHIVPMWSKAAHGMVDTVWPGIAEIRTTAFRTGQYAGIESVEWGPPLDTAFSGTYEEEDGTKTTRTIPMRFPEWCRMTILRELNGKERRFVGPKVVWMESYATVSRWSDIPNDMWRERPEGQLEKCAEAAALRRAFPEEIGNDLTAEEMEGRRIADPVDAARDVTPPPPPPPPPPPAPPPPPSPVPPVDNGDQVEGGDASDEFANWRNDTEGALSGCEMIENLKQVYAAQIKPAKGKVSAADWDAVQVAYRQAFDRVELTD